MPIQGMRKLLAYLDAQANALSDLTKDNLGERLMDVASEVMERDFDAGVTPDGAGWKPLSADYLAFKQKYALTTQMGYLEGVLGETANFRGERTVTPRVAWMTFGVSEQAKDEAILFNAEREFWGFSAESIDRQMKILEKQITI